MQPGIKVQKGKFKTAVKATPKFVPVNDLVL